MDTKTLTRKGNLVYEETKRLLLFGIPWPFEKYVVCENDVVIKSGLLNLKENDCYMYKISDVVIKRSLFQRLFGLSTVILYTSDVTDKTISMTNIKNGKEIKDYILQTSEEARLRRRTVNMQNISFDGDLPGDTE